MDLLKRRRSGRAWYGDGASFTEYSESTNEQQLELEAPGRDENCGIGSSHVAKESPALEDSVATTTGVSSSHDSLPAGDSELLLAPPPDTSSKPDSDLLPSVRQGNFTTVRRSRELGNLNPDHSLVQRLGANGDALESMVAKVVNLDPRAEEFANNFNDQLVDDSGSSDFAEVGAAEGPAADSIAAAQANVAAAAVPSVSGPPVRVDKADSYALFGDISEESKALALRRQLALSLHNWASSYGIAGVALTSLLGLHHGSFGEAIGISPTALGGETGLPETAKTLCTHVDAVVDKLGVNLLVAGSVEFAEEPGLKGPGSKRSVEYFYAPDLARNIIAVLMQPGLEGRVYYDTNLRLPPDYFCADPYFSDCDRDSRNAAIARARATLADDIAEQIPGAEPGQVGIIAIGAQQFTDGVQPHKGNQAAAVTGLLVGISNLTRDVAESPTYVVLGGLINPPKVIRQDKIKAAVGDTSLNASPATLAADARIEAELYERVVAEPMQKLLTRNTIIVRACHLTWLPPDYPYQVRMRANWVKGKASFGGHFTSDALQYVALTFYLSYINADIPEIATLLSVKKDYCPFDGVHGHSLTDVSKKKPFLVSDMGTLFMNPFFVADSLA